MQVGRAELQQRRVFTPVVKAAVRTQARATLCGRSIANETQSSPHDDTAIGLPLVKQGVVRDGREMLGVRGHPFETPPYKSTV